MMKTQTEKQLQDAICELLGFKGIVAIRSRMDRATSNNLGTPDFLFAVRGQAVAWEAKLPAKQCTPLQLAMHQRLQHDGWIVSIITSTDQAIKELESLEQPISRRREPHGGVAAARRAYDSH